MAMIKQIVNTVETPNTADFSQMMAIMADAKNYKKKYDALVAVVDEYKQAVREYAKAESVDKLLDAAKKKNEKADITVEKANAKLKEAETSFNRIVDEAKVEAENIKNLARTKAAEIIDKTNAKVALADNKLKEAEETEKRVADAVAHNNRFVSALNDRDRVSKEKEEWLEAEQARIETLKARLSNLFEGGL